MVADLDHGTGIGDDVFSVDDDVEYQCIETEPLTDRSERQLAGSD